MSNVFQLFEQRKIENLSDPKTIVTIAVAKILASTVELAGRSKNFQSISMLSTTPSMQLATPTLVTSSSKW
jgi:hypothetical protein